MSGDTMGTCPLGGLWYTCTAQSPTFLGCCTSNPCQGNGKTCPASDLRAAGMGTGPGPDPGLTSNDASYWPNVKCSVGKWWTCAMQTPSFQGCCEENPCGGDGTGCPDGILHPAEFSTITSIVPTRTSIVVTPMTSPSATTTARTGEPSTTNSPNAVSATASATPEPSAGGSVPEKNSSSLPIGAIAGGAGVGIVVLIIGLVVFCLCRQRRQKKASIHIDSLPTMGNRPQVASLFMSKGDESGHKQSNPEVYYPDQSIFGVQNATKYTQVRTISPPMSPGPPPYQSPQASPNPNLHEIDSSDVATFGSHNHNRRPLSHVRDGSDLAEDGIAELPHSPAAGNRWRSKRPNTMASVEIGDSGSRGSAISPVSDGRVSANDQRKKGRESYVSWQSLSP